MGYLNKNIYIVVFLSILLILLVPMFLLYYWGRNIPDGFYFSNLLQSDQLTYTSLFRSVWERGNGFFYSYPYSVPGQDNPMVNFQIPFVILAWLWKAFSENIVLTWEVFRFLFGALFFSFVFLSTFEIARSFFKDELKELEHQSYFLVVFLLLIYGGGIAWVFTFFKFLFFNSGLELTFLETFREVEKHYHWWFLNLYRNFMYPLELFYHFLFFFAIYNLIKRRITLVLIAQLLACGSGVFIGIELSAIIIVFFIVEVFFLKNRNNLIYLLTSILIFMVFIFYYTYFLNLFPVTKSIYQQHRIEYDKIPLCEYFYGYGFLTILIPLLFLSRKFRKFFISKFEGRVLLIWMLVVGALIQNDKWMLGKGIQPAHFTRGYFYSVLLLISSIGLFPIWVKVRKKNIKKSVLILILSLVIFLPDNIMFTLLRFKETPHPYPKPLFEFLNRIKEPKVIFPLDRNLGSQIPAFTHHHSMIGTEYTTPFNDEKVEMIRMYFNKQGAERVVKKYFIDIIIVNSEFLNKFEKNVKLPDWKMIYQNATWSVFDTNLRYY
ncbi:MAG: hypothetical protein ABIF11_11320 [Nitrospirota bacterium]